jgi:hypothetical protein
MDGQCENSIRAFFHFILAAKIENAFLPNMKAALGLFLGFLCAVSALAQGTIHFANTATTTLSTNSGPTPPPGQAPNATGLISGAGNYNIGLYIAPQGTTDPAAFSFLVVAQNGAIPGRFDGGQILIPGNTGQTIAFQVRGWRSADGPTFESNPAGTYRGVSTIGFVAPAIGGGGTEIFGTGPGQVGGFVLGNVPEPSTYGLTLLGLALGIFMRRRQARRERH